MKYLSVFFIFLLVVLTDVVDDVLLGYVLGNVSSVVTVIVLWYLVAFFAGLISVYLTKPNNTDLTNFKKFKWQSFGYFLSSIIAAVSFFFAIVYIGISGNAILSNFSVVFLVLFGVVFLKEKLSLKQLFAGLLIIFGLFIFSFGVEPASKLGVVFGLIAVSGGTVMKIFHKTLSTKINYQIITTLRAFFILLVILAVMFALNLQFEFLLSPLIYLAIIGGAVSGPILNKQLMFKVLQSMKLSVFSLSFQISTILVFILGLILLGESASPLKITGAVFVFVGAIIIQFNEKKTWILEE